MPFLDKDREREWRKRYRDGRKDIVNARSRERRRNDPEHQARKSAAELKWQRNNRPTRKRTQTAARYAKQDWVYQQKLGKHCERCLMDDPDCLEFHHRDQSQKVMSLSKAAQQNWAEHRLVAEIAKCSLLCANCHRKEHVQRWRENRPRLVS